MKNLILLLINILLISCSTEPTQENNKPERENIAVSVKIHYEIVKTETGWGYRIYKNNALCIEQLTIPAITGSKSFITSTQARKVAEIATAKLKSGNNFPSVTIEELDSLKINWNY